MDGFLQIDLTGSRNAAAHAQQVRKQEQGKGKCNAKEKERKREGNAKGEKNKMEGQAKNQE